MPPKKSAKSKADGNVHFVAGSDESAVKRAAQELVSRILPGDAGEFGLEVVDGNVDLVDRAVGKIEETIQGLLTLPFFGGAKVVWLKNASFFGDNAMGKSESVASALDKLAAALQAGLPKGISFVLSAPEVDKRRKTYKAMASLAEVHLFDRQELSADPDERAIAIRERASKIPLRLEPEALGILAVRVSDSSRQLDVELEKLSVACEGSSAVTAELVRLLVPATRESGIFDLSNAILCRDLPAAMGTLRQLLQQGESPMGILLVAIFPTVRNLLYVSDLLQRHRLRPPAQPFHFSGTLSRLPETETAHLPRKKDGTLNAYPLGMAAANAQRFSTAQLAKGLVACRKANETLISSQLSEELVLGRLLTELLS